jgi:hypothetical protein
MRVDSIQETEVRSQESGDTRPEPVKTILQLFQDLRSDLDAQHRNSLARVRALERRVALALGIPMPGMATPNTEARVLALFGLVAAHFHTSTADILTAGRLEFPVYIRSIAYALLVDVLRISPSQISLAVHRDRGTIMHGLEKARNLVAIKDPTALRDVEELTAAMEAHGLLVGDVPRTPKKKKPLCASAPLRLEDLRVA